MRGRGVLGWDVELLWVMWSRCGVSVGEVSTPSAIVAVWIGFTSVAEDGVCWEGTSG